MDAQNTPLDRDLVVPIVGPHAPALASVLREAWDQFTVARAAAVALAQASPGARGMLVADFLLEPAHRLFQGVEGVSVDLRYGRPWVNLDGGRVQVRFKKLTPTLAVCASDSDRQVRLSFHLGDTALPGMPEATILTAGYVLDLSETLLQRTVLVCHLGSEVLYSIELPGVQPAVTGPVQLPLAPLAAPVIRSARASVRRRLEERGGA